MYRLAADDIARDRLQSYRAQAARDHLAAQARRTRSAAPAQPVRVTWFCIRYAASVLSSIAFGSSLNSPSGSPSPHRVKSA